MARLPARAGQINSARKFTAYLLHKFSARYFTKARLQTIRFCAGFASLMWGMVINLQLFTGIVRAWGIAGRFDWEWMRIDE